MENTNTPEVSVEVKNENPAENKKNRIGEVAIGLIVLVLLAVLVFVYSNGKKAPPIVNEKATTTKVVVDINKPTRVVNFGTSTPTDFIANIPITKKGDISASYLQEYPDLLTHKSISFSSGKTVAENYTIYKKFLTEGGWTTPDTATKNLTNTEKLSTLYGVKEGHTVNIIIKKVQVPTNQEAQQGTLPAKSFVMISTIKK